MSLSGRHPRRTSTIRTIPFSRVERETVRWLWRGRIALGKIALVEGDGGSGKSTLLAWLAAGTSRGELDGDLWGQPATVIICSAEDSISDTIRPRLEVQGADLDRVLTTDEDLADRTISLPADLEEMRSLIVLTQAKLVIFDPIVSFVATNISSDAEVRRALGPLKEIAEDTGAAIVLLRHLNAQRNAPANRRGLGGAALANLARSVWVLALHPDDADNPECRRVLGHVKGNLDGRVTTSIELSLDQRGRLVIGEELAITADELLLARPRRRASRAPSLPDATIWLREFLANREVSTVEVEEAAARQGISRRTLERARAELGVLHRRVSIRNANGSSTHQTLLRLPGIEPAQDPAPPMASPPAASRSASLTADAVADDQRAGATAPSNSLPLGARSHNDYDDDTSKRFSLLELDEIGGAGKAGDGGVGLGGGTDGPSGVDGVGGAGGVGNSASKNDNSAVQPTPPSNAETEPGEDR